MDGMRNRQQPHPHHPQQPFPRMANWMSEHDAMNDLTSRMAPPSWPLGRRGGPWRERRGSGGSAMSATSEDDSSYDAAANDKSSQGSGGSAGMESVTHEIPIMIEAEMPPSMMQQPTASNQTQQQANNGAVDLGFQKEQAPTKRHSETTAPKLTTNDTNGGQGRATRCASAPPQIVENPHLKQDSSAPQMRSATVPIHNNIAKPFDPSYGTPASSVTQDPIMEETVQPPQQYGDQPPNQNQPPQNQQQFAPDQQQYPPQQQNPQQYYQQQQPYPSNQYPQQQYYPQDQQYEQNPQYSNYPPHHQRQPRFFQQEFYPGRNPDQGYYQQPPMYDNQYGAYPNYYPDAPVGFEDYTQQPQPQRSSQPQPKSSVIRNIPIFIEGQSDPVVNEDRPASLSSSPRTQPTMRPAPPQRGGHPQERGFHPEPQPHQQPQQQHYQQQPPPPQRRAPEAPVRSDQPQPKKSQEVPINIKVQQGGGGPQPHPQVSAWQTPPRQASPAPPPVKLTPLQKIDQIRANNEEILKKVDDFKGNKKDREFLYLDEMLTRALISLDDIDPDGKDDVRQARKALIKDINSKISLLDSLAKEEENKKKESFSDKKENSQEPQCKKESSDGAKKESEAPKETTPAKEEGPKASGENKDSNNSSTAEAPIPLPDK